MRRYAAGHTATACAVSSLWQTLQCRCCHLQPSRYLSSCVLAVVAAFRCAELEAELSRIRELVVLLGATMGRQHGAQQLPSHDDPVWLKLGPLGGVSFALDSVIKHTRVNEGWTGSFTHRASSQWCALPYCACSHCRPTLYTGQGGQGRAGGVSVA